MSNRAPVRHQRRIHTVKESSQALIRWASAGTSRLFNSSSVRVAINAATNAPPEAVHQISSMHISRQKDGRPMQFLFIERALFSRMTSMNRGARGRKHGSLCLGVGGRHTSCNNIWKHFCVQEGFDYSKVVPSKARAATQTQGSAS